MSEAPEVVASRVAAFMAEHDRVCADLGMQVESVSPGNAVISIVVGCNMVNALGICHGGITFSLADTAFAIACNSRNKKTVALACTINYIKQAVPGDRLRATAREVTLSGRTGIYDIEVVKNDSEIIAQFRGTSYALGGEVLEQ